jgi:hypothetical protein
MFPFVLPRKIGGELRHAEKVITQLVGDVGIVGDSPDEPVLFSANEALPNNLETGEEIQGGKVTDEIGIPDRDHDQDGIIGGDVRVETLQGENDQG